MQKTNFFSEMSFAVSRLSNAFIGTGFLMDVYIEGVREHPMFLAFVSKKAITDATNPLNLTCHVQDKESAGKKELTRCHSADFYCLGDGLDYLEHPNQHVDLAYIDISCEVDFLDVEGFDIFGESFTEDMLLDDSDPKLFLGQEVWFLGYPNDEFDAINTLPVLRHGFIASNPDVDFNGKPEFVIDASVTPGSNGSPVFVKLKDGQFRLAGVLTGPAKKEGAQMGVVLKAKAVSDLIRLVKMREIAEMEYSSTAQKMQKTRSSQ